MVKFLVMDVDGTLTDGKIYMSQQGEAFKAFDIKDGCGIKDILPKYGIIPVIITARESNMLLCRCKELGITELYQNCREKLLKLNEIVESYSKDKRYTLADVAYIGDDILDVECMEKIKTAGGYTVCPKNAVDQVKKLSCFICRTNGGEGAVREFIDWYTAKVDSLEMKQIKMISEKAYKFIKNFSPNSMKDGRYEISKDVFANVMTYTTKPFDLTVYESHLNHIDIQYILYGAEVLVTEDVSKLKNNIYGEYSPEDDTVFYKYDAGNVKVLKAGDVVILHPEDAHRGAIVVDSPQTIRKIVVKVLC